MAHGIDRRNFVLGLASTGLIGHTGLGRAAEPPNIVFLMADDLGYADIGVYGAREIRTPHIDGLAHDGVMLTNGYANSSICSPTRTALLTGCYQQRFRVGLEEPLGPWAPEGTGVPLERPTIASVLRDRGYETALVGKWHLGDPPEHSPLAHGYDHFFGIIDGAADYFRHRIVIGGRDVSPGLKRDDDEIEANGYMTDLLGDEAVAWIKAADEKNHSSSACTSRHRTGPGKAAKTGPSPTASSRVFTTMAAVGKSTAKWSKSWTRNIGKGTLRHRGSRTGGQHDRRFHQRQRRRTILRYLAFHRGQGRAAGGRHPRAADRALARPDRGRQPFGPGHDLDGLPPDPAGRRGRRRRLLPTSTGLKPAAAADRAGRARRAHALLALPSQRAGRGPPGRLEVPQAGRQGAPVSTSPKTRASGRMVQDLYPEKFAALKALYARWNDGMLPYPEKTFSEQVKQNYPDRY